MSGGAFGYQQYRISEIADSIEQYIISNDDESLNEWGEKRGRFYSKEVMDKFIEGVDLLGRAAIYAQRIDWLVSDDDGEDSFLERLKEDLEKEKSERERKR